MLLGLITLITSFFYVPLVSSAYGLIYGGFIMLAFNSAGIKKALSNPFMIWLGERSYSLFLIHFSVFYFTNYLVSNITSERDGTYALLTRTIGIPLALFLAMLLFHLIERRQARGLLTAKAFWPWQAKKAIAEHGF
jgi:peptidoglycan/LPS O-acetylase OafA/YrhL